MLKLMAYNCNESYTQFCSSKLPNRRVVKSFVNYVPCGRLIMFRSVNCGINLGSMECVLDFECGIFILD